jgi:hypothetical protein
MQGFPQTPQNYLPTFLLVNSHQSNHGLPSSTEYSSLPVEVFPSAENVVVDLVL